MKSFTRKEPDPPMDPKIKPRRTQLEKIVNDVLVALNSCLAIVAMLLASVMFIKLQVISWQTSDSVYPSLAVPTQPLPAQVEVKTRPSQG
jgi:hypothetical protein